MLKQKEIEGTRNDNSNEKTIIRLAFNLNATYTIIINKYAYCKVGLFSLCAIFL